MDQTAEKRHEFLLVVSNGTNAAEFGEGPQLVVAKRGTEAQFHHLLDASPQRRAVGFFSMRVTLLCLIREMERCDPNLLLLNGVLSTENCSQRLSQVIGSPLPLPLKIGKSHLW